VTSNDPDQEFLEIPIKGTGIFIDTEPPRISQCHPPHNAQSVPQNTKIEFKLDDSEQGKGLNLDTFNLLINSDLIVLNGDIQTGGNVTISENHSGYMVHYQPILDFPKNSVVTIQVRIEDCSSTPNLMDSTYFFQIGNVVAFEKTSEVIDSTGGIITCDSTYLEMIVPPGALEDSVKISIGTVDNPPTLPDSVKGMGLTYHFWPEGLQLADSITLRIPYNQEDLESVGVNTPFNLPLYYYLTSSGEWIKLIVFEADSEFVSVRVNEFCYLVLGKESKETETSIQRTLMNPDKFVLHQNYPNPFNPETHIRFYIPEPGFVKLEIYNNMGQRVKTILNSYQKAGNCDILWTARNDNNENVSSGIYHIVIFYQGKRKTIPAAFIK